MLEATSAKRPRAAQTAGGMAQEVLAPMHDDRIRRVLDRQASFAERLSVEPDEAADGLGRRVMLGEDQVGRVRFKENEGWCVECWNGNGFDVAPEFFDDPDRRCDRDEVDRHAVGAAALALAEGTAKARRS